MHMDDHSGSTFNSLSLSSNFSLAKETDDHDHDTFGQNASLSFSHQFLEKSEDRSDSRYSSFHENSRPIYTDDEEESDNSSARENVLVHGFSFGNVSVPFEQKDNCHEDEEEDDSEEDEGLGVIYGTDEGLLGLQAESKSFGKPSPVANRHHVISKQIDRVGHIGQNIGLGHRIGIFAEDSELRPKPVSVEKREYILDEDSPLQTDIHWKKPGNAANFKLLTYEIEMKSSPQSDQWLTVASVKFPVFRVYHTDDKIFIGKRSFLRQAQDVTYTLRVRSLGEVTLPSTFIQNLESDWSKDITVTFLGYESIKVLEQTNL